MKKILFIVSVFIFIIAMAPAIKFFWRVVAVGMENPVEVIAVSTIGLIGLYWYEIKEKISTAIETLL